MPEEDRLLTSYDSWTGPMPVPPTFPGTRFAGASLDDVRWRVVGLLVPGGRHDREPTTTSLFWDAKEVVLTDAARPG